MGNINWEETEAIARQFNKAFKASAEILKVVEAVRAAEGNVSSLLSKAGELNKTVNTSIIENERLKTDGDELDNVIKQKKQMVDELNDKVTKLENILESGCSQKVSELRNSFAEAKAESQETFDQLQREHSEKIKAMDSELEAKEAKIKEVNAALKGLSEGAGVLVK